MNKEQLQQDIDSMRQKLSEMEARLEESDKIELEHGYSSYMIYTTHIDVQPIDCDYLKHARYRDTKEQAARSNHDK